jgi:hypothetical protein
MDIFSAKIGVPKIQPCPYNHIVSAFTKLLADSNPNISIFAIKICGQLAKGLRESFREGALKLMGPILQKLKEKRGQVIDEAKNTFLEFENCV